MKSFKLFFLMLNVSIIANAQLDNRLYSMDHEETYLGSGKAAFGVYALGFARNTEYANLLKEGRTYMGYQILPSFHYKVDTSFYFKLGAYVRQDFGNDRLSHLEPVFQMKYRRKYQQFILGTLEGNLSHDLIEPLYDFENVINDPIENGIQYLLDHPKFKADIWVDWRRMIYPGSPFQEAFSAGLVGDINVFRNRQWRLAVPVQLFAQHKGGEIDASPDPVLSLYNSAFGGKLIYRPQKSKLRSIDLQLYGTYYLDASRIVVDSFIDGNGSYASLNFKWNHLNMMLNYWDSYQFQAPLGDPVFHSVSDENPDRLFFVRRMAMFRLGYEKALSKHVSFLGRAQYIHDLNHGQSDVIFELYLRYRQLHSRSKS